MPHHSGPYRQIPGSHRRQRERGESGQERLLWLPQEGMGLVCIISADSGGMGYLVSGPRVIKAKR